MGNQDKIVVVSAGNDGLMGFFGAIMKQQECLTDIGESIAKACSLPFLGDRSKGKENSPDSYNDISEAINKLGHPVGIYYHYPTMNLVLLETNGTKIGIRSTSLRHIFGATFPVESLIGAIKEKINTDKSLPPTVEGT